MWLLLPGIEVFQRIAPSVVSTQISQRSLPSFDADCRKSESPQTTGDEWPTPGIASFQSRFSFSLKLSGTSLSSVVPAPLGPRKRGQLPACAKAVARRRAASVRSRVAFVMVEGSHIRRGSEFL